MLSKLKENLISKFNENRISSTMIFLMLAFIGVNVIIAAVTGGRSVYNMLCADHTETFSDYFYSIVASYDHPYTIEHVIYPPLVTAFYSVIGHFTIPFVTLEPGESMIYALRDSQMGMMSYFMISLISVVVFYVLVQYKNDSAKSKLFFIMFLVSYPLLFSIERGNSITLILPLCMIFLLGYESENKYIRIASYVALSIAVGLKIYPIVFGLLIIRRREYRNAAICAVIGLLFFFVPFIFTDGNLSILIDNISAHASKAYGSIGMTSIHYLLNSLLGGILSTEIIKILGYLLAAIVFLLFAAIVVLDDRMQYWKILTLIVCAMMFGPAVAIIQYMLILLAIPILFFLLEEKEMTYSNIFFIICFVVAMAMLPGFESEIVGYSQNVILYIKSAFMIVVAIYIMVEGTVHLYRKYHAGKSVCTIES